MMEKCSRCGKDIWCWEEVNGKNVCNDCIKKKQKKKESAVQPKSKSRIPLLKVIIHRPWIEFQFRKRSKR